MSIAYINGANSGSITVGPSSPFTFTANIPAASLVVVSFRCASAGANVTAVTVGGVSCTVESFVAFGVNSQIQMAYCYNFAGNSSATISITFSGVAAYGIGWIDWFSGIQTSSDPFDVITTSFSTSGGTNTTNSFSTAQASELCYVIASSESTGGSWSPGTGFTTAQAAPGGNGCAAYSMYQVYSTIQSSVTASAVETAGVGSGIQAILFKGATATTSPRLLGLLGCGK